MREAWGQADDRGRAALLAQFLHNYTTNTSLINFILRFTFLQNFTSPALGLIFNDINTNRIMFF